MAVLQGYAMLSNACPRSLHFVISTHEEMMVDGSTAVRTAARFSANQN
jgi:hypothetical protein